MPGDTQVRDLHGDATLGDAPAAARLLSLAGLAPFVAFALGSIAAGPDLARLFQDALIAYGAIILSFMGGCRWGFAAVGLGQSTDWTRFAIAVLPALYAWPMTMVEFRIGALGLSIGLIALYIADLRLSRDGGAPAWWPNLRWPLTLVAVICLVSAGLA